MRRPGKPAIIEFEERLAAKNDTIKVAPVGAAACLSEPEEHAGVSRAGAEDSLD